MNKEKWYSVGCFALSILFLLIALGTAAWHFFHDHHGDTRLDSSTWVEPAWGNDVLKKNTPITTGYEARGR